MGRPDGPAGWASAIVWLTAPTSAEISLPTEADGARVSDRIAVLAGTVDVVGLTDNHRLALQYQGGGHA